MGYTHYFSTNREFSQQQWDDVKAAANKVIKAATDKGILLTSDDEENPVLVDDTRINLNALYSPHETFLVQKKVSRDFCKTNRKPYDVVVGAILLYLAKHHSNNFTFTSDGGSRDWKEAVEFANEVFHDLFEEFAPS